MTIAARREGWNFTKIGLDERSGQHRLVASGSGTYNVSNGHAQLDLSFTSLIPDGAYSLWCGRQTAPPNYTSVEVPCGTPDGVQNQFRADAAGKANLTLELKPLLPSTQEAVTVLSLSFDRAVSAPEGELGGYGLSNQVQLWFAFP